MTLKGLLKASPLLGLLAGLVALACVIALLSIERLETDAASKGEEPPPTKEAKRQGCLRKDGIWICHTP